MISHMLLQTLGGPQFKKMVKISPALTCLPGLAAGWLYVKELENVVSTRNLCCYPEERWISHFAKR